MKHGTVVLNLMVFSGILKLQGLGEMVQEHHWKYSGGAYGSKYKFLKYISCEDNTNLSIYGHFSVRHIVWPPCKCGPNYV
ncbi:hypothetical protein VNO77_28656 [Canavalia gladiata]|uniref:Uncharacterized protein n=1 Tax=Canavalia gladiata TaxID=3824 RepID=A0AAN9L0J7_CANGL